MVTALLTTSAGEGEGGVVPVERVESVVTAGANCIVLVLSGLSSTAAPVIRRSGGEEGAGAGVTGGCDSAPAGGEDGGEDGGGGATLETKEKRNIVDVQKVNALKNKTRIEKASHNVFPYPEKEQHYLSISVYF